MNPSNNFSRNRVAFSLALLVLGFALLAFALLMDARLTPSPYTNEPSPVTIHGDQ